MKLSTNQMSGYLFETTITLKKANLNNLSKQVQNQANIEWWNWENNYEIKKMGGKVKKKNNLSLMKKVVAPQTF
jgi:hypothetical protein